LRGETTLEEAVAAIKRETRRLVRHQANWFKGDDPAIHWFDTADGAHLVDTIERFVRDWLGATSASL
jgi:tRNA A37 N6-isopentenylltransferase MiaA